MDSETNTVGIMADEGAGWHTSMCQRSISGIVARGSVSQPSSNKPSLAELWQSTRPVDDDIGIMVDLTSHNRRVEGLEAIRRQRHQDPAIYFPEEIVVNIFEFFVQDHFFSESPPAYRRSQTTTDAPVMLSSVSRLWHRISMSYAPLWSNVYIDPSDDDCPHRLLLSLHLSANTPLNVKVLGSSIPSTIASHLQPHGSRIKTFSALHHPQSSWSKQQPRRLRSINGSWAVGYNQFVSDAWLVSANNQVIIPIAVSHLSLHDIALSPLSFAGLGSLKDLTSLSIILRQINIMGDDVSTATFPALRDLSLEVLSPQWNWIEVWPRCPQLQNAEITFTMISEAIWVQFWEYVPLPTGLKNLSLHINIEQPDNFKVYRQGSAPVPQFHHSYDAEIHCHITGDEGFIGTNLIQHLSVITKRMTVLSWNYFRVANPSFFAHLECLELDEPQSSIATHEDKSEIYFYALREIRFSFWSTDYLHQLSLFRTPALNNLVIQCKAVEVYQEEGLSPINLQDITNGTLSLIRFDDERLSLMYIASMSLPSARQVQIPFHFLQACIFGEVLPGALCVMVRRPARGRQVHGGRGQFDALLPNWDMKVPPYAFLVTSLDWSTRRRTPLGNMNITGSLELFFHSFSALRVLALPCAPFTRIPYIDELVTALVAGNTKNNNANDLLPHLEQLHLEEYPTWTPFLSMIRQRQFNDLLGDTTRARFMAISFGVVLHDSLRRRVEDALSGRYTIDNIVLPRREGPGEDWPNRPFNLLSTRYRKVRACYGCSMAGLEVGCETHLKAWPRCSKYLELCRKPTVIFAPFVDYHVPFALGRVIGGNERTVCYT